MEKCWCGNDSFSSYSDGYWVCGECQTLVDKKTVAYDPDSIQDDRDFYGSDYWKTKMVQTAGVRDISEVVDLYFKERAVYWLKTLFTYLLPGQGKIAEVGCGLGQFSYLLKMCGYEQIAYELSPEICEYVRKELRINISCSSFKKTEGTYDAIVSFDVLEHLTDPRALVEDACASLKSGGILMMQTPCYDPALSYSQMQQQKPRFESLMLPGEHLYLFSRASVTRLLNECGFPYVEFKDAFFGNDYDMFFVASREPLKTHTPEEIDAALNAMELGRLIKALVNVWTMLRERDENALGQIETLTKMVKDVEANAMDQILTLHEMLKEQERRHEEETVVGMLRKMKRRMSNHETGN